MISSFERQQESFKDKKKDLLKQTLESFKSYNHEDNELLETDLVDTLDETSSDDDQYSEDERTPEWLIEKRGNDHKMLRANLQRDPWNFVNESETGMTLYKSEIFQERINNLLKEKKYSILGSIAADELATECGLKSAINLDLSKPETFLLLAEAVNWAAKTHDRYFYELKPALIVCAIKLGCNYGVHPAEDPEWDHDIYYLQGKDIGVASFHDPDEEVRHLLIEVLKEKEVKIWPHPWSGIARQSDAFQILNQHTSSDPQNTRLKKYYDYFTKPKTDRIKQSEDLLIAQENFLDQMMRKFGKGKKYFTEE